GFAAGIYFVVRNQAALAAKGWRGNVAVLVAPFLSLVLAAYLGRMGYEAIGFAGATPAAAEGRAPIIDTDLTRSGSHIAVVTTGPGTRELRVNVTRDLYSRLDAYRHPGRDCLILTVQTGRYGIRRALLPTVLTRGVDVDRLVPCPAG